MGASSRTPDRASVEGSGSFAGAKDLETSVRDTRRQGVGGADPRRTSRTPGKERLQKESVTVLFRTLEAGPNLLFRFVDADPRRTLDRLPRLEIFVDAEEVLDLEQQVLANVVDVSNVVSADIRGRNADDLVVTARLIPHPEHGNSSAGDQAPGKCWLRHQHQRV